MASSSAAPAVSPGEIDQLTEDEVVRELETLTVGDDGRLEDSAPSGGYLFDNHEEIKAQRKAMLKFVKTLGKNFFMGKDLIGVSLPVVIFEARSFLERLTDNWSYAPLYLQRAAETDDPIERFKNVITFAIAGLHCTCHHRKPFNPILGETYQATYPNGTEVFCEQTSHHPPVSHWHITGPNDSYLFSGYGSWSASFRGNSIKGQQSGPNVVRFPDGTVIEWSLPYLWLHGILWGQRVMEYGGTVTFRDLTNNLVCELKFDPEKPGMLKSIGNLFTRNKRPPSDLIRGEICQVSRQLNGKEQRTVVSKVQGTWLGYIEFSKTPKKDDFERYWDTRTANPERPTPVENPLPSDCRFREDLMYLKSGDEVESQKWKELLEEKQRKERRLREAHAKKNRR